MDSSAARFVLRPVRERVLTGRTGRKVAVGVVLLAGLALFVAGLFWYGTGGRWAVIETPSMGTAAPVGTLVLTRPRPLASLHPGDVIMYRAPPRGVLYTHRVVGASRGGLTARGDVNGAADPYPVTADNLVGKVVATFPALGYLIRALPFLLVSGLVVIYGTRPVPLYWRSSARVFLLSVTVTASALVLRPWVHLVLLSSARQGAEVQATVISAGLLPTRVVGAPHHHVDLLSGQVRTLLAQPATPDGASTVTGTVHLSGWWMVAVLSACAVPLVWCAAVGLSPTETARAAERRDCST